MKFTSLLTLTLTAAGIAAPASAGLLDPLVAMAISYVPIMQHVPMMIDGLNMVAPFPACAQTCLFSIPAPCAICEFDCRCRDYGHVHKQASCMRDACTNQKDLAAAYKAWSGVCAPYLKNMPAAK